MLGYNAMILVACRHVLGGEYVHFVVASVCATYVQKMCNTLCSSLVASEPIVVKLLQCNCSSAFVAVQLLFVFCVGFVQCVTFSELPWVALIMLK